MKRKPGLQNTLSKYSLLGLGFFIEGLSLSHVPLFSGRLRFVWNIIATGPQGALQSGLDQGLFLQINGEPRNCILTGPRNYRKSHMVVIPSLRNLS